VPLPAAAADARGDAGRDLPLTGRGCVGGKGIGALAPHTGCGVLGGSRGPAEAEPAGRDARPARPQPRRHHSLDEVRRLLAAAGAAVASAQDELRRRPGSPACAHRLFAAEQLLMLVRLAADCRGTAGRAGRAAAIGPGRAGAHHRAQPVRWRPGLNQIRADPAGNPRLGHGGHDSASLPVLGGPSAARTGLAVQPVATTADPPDS
jgi:hypothetical protein